jgi:hypothetical protein
MQEDKVDQLALEKDGKGDQDGGVKHSVWLWAGTQVKEQYPL